MDSRVDAEERFLNAYVYREKNSSQRVVFGFFQFLAYPEWNLSCAKEYVDKLSTNWFLNKVRKVKYDYSVIILFLPM